MDNLNFWPYTDIHELNLDWILEKVKELDTKLNVDIESYIQQYIDEHFEDWTVNANYDPNTQTIVYTNGTGAQQTLGDVIRFAIDNVFVAIKDAVARGEIGTLTDLTTTDKDTIVDAVNELKASIDAEIAKTGALTDLNTTDKDSIVEAVNEVNTATTGAVAHIGTLSNLVTTNKSNLVSALNETTNKVNGIYRTARVTELISSGDVITLNTDERSAKFILLTFSRYGISQSIMIDMAANYGGGASAVPGNRDITIQADAQPATLFTTGGTFGNMQLYCWITAIHM